LWAWGKNNNGNLGLGNITNYSSPKQVGALTTWSQASAGLYNSLAIKTDGTLWAWGWNRVGSLGLSDTISRSSPVQVGALTGWSKVAAQFQYFTVAIKTNGTLWAWGKNSQGQLGLGNTIYYSSPKQVGALTTWSTIGYGYRYTTSLAIKTNGTLWSWGYNGQGQLGLGNVTSYSSPKQVGALTTWSQVAGARYSSLAIKTDGTLWSWGQNDKGQLGLGNITSYSSPKQVGALTTWSQVSAGYKFSLSTTTVGALWSWGDNVSGQLGLGNTTNRSSPVQVGALTNWSQVSGGGTYGFSLALKT
jgi:alpha-tubulin suppressor-like RCC1 family protein